MRLLLDTHRPLDKRTEVPGDFETFSNLAGTLFPIILLSSLNLNFGPRFYNLKVGPLFLTVSSVTMSAFLLILLYPMYLIGKGLELSFGKLRGSIALYLVSTSIPLSFPADALPPILVVPASILFSIIASYYLFGKKVSDSPNNSDGDHRTPDLLILLSQDVGLPIGFLLSRVGLMNGWRFTG